MNYRVRDVTTCPLASQHPINLPNLSGWFKFHLQIVHQLVLSPIEALPSDFFSLTDGSFLWLHSPYSPTWKLTTVFSNYTLSFRLLFPIFLSFLPWPLFFFYLFLLPYSYSSIMSTYSDTLIFLHNLLFLVHAVGNH